MEIRKFIIIDGELVMGTVEHHAELIPSRMYGKIKPIGGGRWEWNKERYPNKLFFFGSSYEFKGVTEEQLRDAYENTLVSLSFENCEVIYSTKEYFSQVLIENGL